MPEDSAAERSRRIPQRAYLAFLVFLVSVSTSLDIACFNESECAAKTLAKSVRLPRLPSVAPSRVTRPKSGVLVLGIMRMSMRR